MDRRLDKAGQPVGLREPSQANAPLALDGLERKIDLLLAAFQLGQNFLAVYMQQVSKQVGVGCGVHTLRQQDVLGM